MNRQQQTAAKTPPLLSGIAETVEEPLPEFRHWVDGDYPREKYSPVGMFILCGFVAGFWTVAILAVVKYWPVISGWFA